MRIALDVFGGDLAPQASIEGVSLFLQENKQAHVLLIGYEDAIQKLMAEHGISTTRIDIIHTTEYIGMDEQPVQAFQQKPKNSISVGLSLVKERKADAFISAGNTGAMLVGASLILSPIKGVQRPTIGTYYPQKGGAFAYLLDVGLNMDCKPEHLVGFAQLGSTYMRVMHHIGSPRVALLNVGQERGKGNQLTKKVYELLSRQNDIYFIGNIEGRDLHNQIAEVIVCDGFLGNILLKHAEAIYDLFKDRIDVNIFNYELYGGTPILGIEGVAIIGHGISNRTAFKNMLHKAAELVEKKLIENIQSDFEKKYVLR
ncbi:MAG: phosphate acyltransferase PlsX [Bacteroidia bacterium]|nr:phosphate acyltransferase PlsX [Bacteroidia bacterium]MDW8347140.1 phosphate acyltransferase PlsX [Bacteroidia bacterium]